MECFVPSELLLDAFRFLNRNELEKCQRLNRRWRTIVDYNGGHMALRPLANLAIWEVDNDAIALANAHRNPNMSWQNLINSSGINTERIRSLKYCIFNACSAQTELRLIVKALKCLSEISGCKIKVFRYGCTNEPYDGIQEICNYIDVQKIMFNENQDIRRLFLDPVRFPVPPMKITMKVDNTIVNSDELLDFLESGRLHEPRRYALTFTSFMPWKVNFCSELIRIYTRAKNPKKLVHSLKFNINDGIPDEMPHTQFYRWLETNVDGGGRSAFSPHIKIVEKRRKETYVLKQSSKKNDDDTSLQHMIKVVIVKNFENTVRSWKLKVECMEESKVSYKSLKMDDNRENPPVNEDIGDEHWNPAWSWCSIM